jgi:hypothetical protein
MIRCFVLSGQWEGSGDLMALGRMFASGKDPEAEHSCGRSGLGLFGKCCDSDNKLDAANLESSSLAASIIFTHEHGAQVIEPFK